MNFPVETVDTLQTTLISSARYSLLLLLLCNHSIVLTTVPRMSMANHINFISELERENGCVAKTGGSLVQVAFVLSDRYLLHEFQTSIQVASFPPRNHPTQRAMVLPLLVELPGFGGDDARTRC